jgi:ribosomal protein S18 acetylase RimI-like enzyme
MEPIAIRSAGAADEARVLALMVLAFAGDPFARWVIPDPHDHFRLMPDGARAFGGNGFAHGTVHVTECGRAAAMWLPPGIEPDHERMGAVFAEGMPPENLDAIEAVTAAMQAAHPAEPFWYLPLIGTDPAAQGRGLGDALMRHALARIDAEGGTAYLESSNPRNRSLYLRHGFEPLPPIQAGTSPELLPMLRRPRR